MLRLKPLAAAAVQLALCCLSIVTPSVASAQSVLSDPDFSGMYQPSSTTRIVARDGARGWTYLVLGNDSANSRSYFINGVRTSPLVRINELGLPDLDWTVDPAVVPSYAQVLGNGELLIYDTAWRRLLRDSDGVLRAVALPQPFEPGALPRAQPNARDAAGNVYILYSRTAGSPVDALRRFSANGNADTNWRLQIDLSFGTPIHVTVAADGSIYYVSAFIQPPFSSGVPGAATLVRVSGSDGSRWTRPLGGAVAAINTDPDGRVYLLGRNLSLQGKSGNLLRVDTAGNVDTGWSATPALTGATSDAALCVANGAAVAAIATATPPSAARATVELTRVALASSASTSRTMVADSAVAAPTCADGQTAVLTQRSLVLASANASALSTRDIAAVSGTPALIAAVQRWNQYLVVGGRFEYWFEGVRYRNLMRLGTDLRPDPSWRPAIDGEVAALAADNGGGLLVGGDRLTPTQPYLLRFGSNGQADSRWARNLDGPVFALAVATTGETYAGGRFNNVDGNARPAFVRLLADGSLDVTWVPTLPPYVPILPTLPALSLFTVNGIVVANEQDLLVTWQNFGLDYGGAGGILRLSRGNGSVTAAAEGFDRVVPTTLVRDPFTGALFGLRQLTAPPFGAQLVQLFAETLEPDPSWTPVATIASPVAFDGQHVLLSDGSRVLRGSGRANGRWVASSGRFGGYVAISNDAIAWPTLGAPIAVRSPAVVIGPRTVVEYFAKDANRFFITARPNEQATLDALPAAFVRTGMQFQAFDGTVLSPAAGVGEGGQGTPPATGSQTVCRYFTPRERGGSGTHFYGLPADCQLLNTFTGFVNEGYDFALHAARAGTCPAATPIAVYRLFNNRAAQNDGNHRYVVSTTRRDEMLARGWVDEGVVFCVSAATDSRAFGNW